MYKFFASCLALVFLIVAAPVVAQGIYASRQFTIVKTPR